MKLGQYTANLESLENELPEAEDELASAETATEVAEVSGETAAAETDISSLDTGIADAEAAEDKIEELQGIAEASLAGDNETVSDGEVGQEGEGLSQGEANLIEITHESIMKSVGFARERVTYTAESFVGDNRRQATLEALEGLKDSAKKLGGNIVAALKAALNTVMNFIAGLLRNRALMAKHLANLAEKVKAIPANATKKAETLKAGAKALSVAGQANVKTAELVITGGAHLVDYSVKLANDIASIKSADEAAKRATSVITNEVHATNGRTLAVKAGEEGSVNFAFEEGKTAEEIQAPDRNQMAGLLKKAQVVLDELRKFEVTQAKFKSAVSAIIARLGEVKDTVMSKVGSEEGKAKAGESAEAKKQARLARNILSKAGAAFPSAAFASVKAVADYVTAGVNNYKAAEAAAAPAAKK